MPALRELQRAFADAVRRPGPAGVLDRIEPAGLTPARRLAIYRNNVRASLLRVLQGNFPATRRRAGEGPFDTVARAFIAARPPQAPQLHAWGDAFPTFLSKTGPTRGREDLAALATLEWAREAAYHAADAASLTAADLAAVPIGRYPALCLPLHPTAVLLPPRWPLWSWWAGDDAADAPEAVLVLRPAMEVLTLRLGPGEHALLAALHDGLTLADAAAAATGAEAGLDLQAVLARHLAGGTFAVPSPA
ncbi:MAG: DNA-binding domain-containing protein [Geminicoccaceae bacterium]